MKRAFDLLVAAVALVLASPVLALIALVVKVDSGGPVLFRQERVGRGGQLFEIRKFRTMTVSAGGPLITVEGDARVTRTGRWLRASKLDELPQLTNVLAGEMSIVGPRPEVPCYVERWPEEARRVILQVRPGITDPASVVYRRESEELAAAADPERLYREEILPRKVALYREYVASRSFLGDLKIITQTIRAVVGG